MTDLIARLTALEKEATPGPWTSRDEKRGAKKSIWRADTAREVSEAEWGPQFADRPSRYGPHREDVANCFSKETAALIVELRNALPAILHALKVNKAAEAWVEARQTIDEQPLRWALVRAVKGEQG